MAIHNETGSPSRTSTVELPVITAPPVDPGLTTAVVPTIDMIRPGALIPENHLAADQTRPEELFTCSERL
ncbi:hypothetical protein GCM10009838_88860 [Catenulispora subtropica]|uniref:Uncharacterized protein n=1 Tax=Catenulispora subtropica TaxID=450798 RepID=A0ABN2THG0_9ACTN